MDLAEIETDVFLMGNWKSIDDLEFSITLEELFALHRAIYRSEHRRNKFAAALKGVDLDDFDAEEEETPFEKIKRQAEADLAGKTEDEFVFDMIGIEIETDDD